ncbi:MAG: ABC transporter ATP-binding protein/permease [Atopostipes suicloacalis]|nr:ABC transporter ATP-binding protein/permease [Atopostipes suicloacalis]MDN6730927.1 ABC transporter ATP-binding protein/permease [Atopostipes suicloacalis]
MKRIIKLLEPKRIFWLIVFITIQTVALLAIPTVSANIVDYGVAPGDIDYIVRNGGIMILIAFLGFGGAILNVYFAATESQGVGTKLRKKLFDKIMFFSSEEIDQFGTSTLITRTTSDVLQIQRVLMPALRLLILNPLRIVIAASLAFSRNAKLSLIFIVIIPILVIFIALVLRKVTPLFRTLQVKTDELNRVFREGLTGIRVIRAFNREDYEEERFDEVNTDYKETSILSRMYLAFLNPVMIFLASATSIMIIWFGGQLVSMDEMLVGNLIAFTSYSVNILLGIMGISVIITMLPRALVAIERIYEVVETEDSIVDAEETEEIDKNLDELNLVFENVDFRYPGAEKLALEDISFSMKAGEKLAIIGGTGAGKSTLAELILRLYDIESGSIKINGVDIREMTQSYLRQLIGFATQDALLFSGTIRENLKYGNEKASDEEIWEALDIAQGYEFVNGLDKKLDARVEQGGSNFSGGQRQRLSIARTLITEANILVFDDSFSALDFQTDARLRAALEPVTTEKLVMIIAQRINTVMDADQILVLDNGHLVGIGSHEELKENNEIYQEIMDSQMKGDDL